MIALSRRIVGTTGAALLGAGMLVSSLTACASPKQSCPSILWTPGSDDVSSEVTTYGAACSTARAILFEEHYREQAGQLPPFSAYAFRCTAFNVVPQGLAYRQFLCFGPSGKAITWKDY